MSSQETRDREPSAAMARGDIQKGRTGDKKPGFDPATAPLETDAEAGNTDASAAAMPESATLPQRGAQAGAGAIASGDAHADAMRPFHPGDPPKNSKAGLIVTMVVVVVLATVAIYLLMGL